MLYDYLSRRRSPLLPRSGRDGSISLEREQAAQERAKLLQAVATVANSLLRSPDYRTVLPEVLQILGEAAKSDRCSLTENVLDPVTGEAAVKICTEWCRQDIQASIDHTPELENALLWSYFPQFEEKLRQGKTSTFLIDDLSEPARSILQAQGNISLTLVPIVVQGKFWGVFGFDYCQQARLFAEADKAIFAIAVDSIAAAIEREQQDEALKASEKRYRTLFELSNEGIYHFEFTSPFSTSLSIEEQVECGYQYFQIAEVNTAYVNQYGFNTSEEIIRKGFKDFYPEDSALNRESNRRIIENGYRIRNAETEEIGVDGEPRYFLSNVVCDIQDGYVIGGWGTQTDITELKQAQQALLEAERQRVAQLEESNQILSLRDRWLEATANAANRLLATPDLDTGINAALKVLGESLDCDRVQIWQLIYTSIDSKRPELGQLIYEWKSSNISSQILHPNLNQIPVEELGEEWIAQLLSGEWVGGILDELQESFRSGQTELRVNSTYMVPFFLNGTWWGTVSIDYCREVRRLTLPEIAVFKTAASCVGSAIYRQQIQQEKEQAERQRLLQLEESNLVLTLRDRWLEATANAANRLLATPDLDAGINAALKVLGESLDCDRVDVMQHFEDDTGKTSGFMRMLYEWDSPGTISQLHHSQLSKIYDTGIEDLLAKMIKGEWLGGLIEEFPEPFRSRQIELGVKSTYAVPIFVNSTFWGILGIDYCREARRLTLPEIAVFKTAASCVGSAIYRQQIQQEKEQAEKTIILEREQAAVEKAAELTKVNAVLSRSLDKLTYTADLDEFLGQVVLEITHQVGAVDGRIFLYNEDNNTLETFLSVRHGIIYQGTAEHDPPLFHSPFSADISPVFQYLLETKEISLLSTNNDADFTLWWEDTLEWHRRMGHQEAAAIALSIGDKPLGILGLAFTEKSSLKPEELELIYALTNQASLAIQLTNLAQQAQECAVTGERNRMAREIHDTLAQAFTGISLQLEAARNSLTIDPEIASERLLQAKNLAKEGIIEARRSVRALRPEAMELGLPTALRQLVDKMLLGTKIKPEIFIEGETRTLTPQIEAELFRIAQEALTNVIRHAQATEISIQLIYEPDTIYLQIKDNGIGFDLQQLQSEGFGLLGMRERCDRLDGDLVINSVIGEGTEITITVATN